MMPTQFKIEKIERPIIDYFIANNNKISWIAKISKDLRKNISNVLKQIKKLEDKGILKQINCPDELIEKIKEGRKKGGSFPSDCYLLDYDMNTEWFVEIARSYFDTNDIKTKMNFMRSGFTHRMIHSKKFINSVIENRLTIKINDNEKFLLPFIFNSFPSTLRWVLFGDLSIVDKCISDITTIEPEIDLKKRFYFAYINSKIIEDFVEGEYLQQKSLSRIRYSFTTEFKFLNLFPQKSKGIEEKSYGTLTGGSIFEFKKISKKKFYKKDTKK